MQALGLLTSRVLSLIPCIVSLLLVTAPAASASPTTVAENLNYSGIGESSQRRSFTYDSIHYVCFHDSGATAIKCSSNDGSGWRSAGAEIPYDTADFSVFFDSSREKVFIAAINGDGRVIVRHGIVHMGDITLDSAVVIALNPAAGFRFREPTMALDTASRLWVAGVNSPVTSHFDLRQAVAVRSTATVDSALAFGSGTAIGKKDHLLQHLSLLPEPGEDMVLLMSPVSGNIVSYRYESSSGDWLEANPATPEAWLGFGVNQSIKVVEIAENGDLYVGGNFKILHAVDKTSLIAKYDNAEALWEPLGSGITGESVNAIEISGTDVYVGGKFSSAGGVDNTKNLALWNGSAWASVGAGAVSSPSRDQDEVHALGIYNGELYVGGDFRNIQGSGYNYLAKWTGSGWDQAFTTVYSGTLPAVPDNVVRVIYVDVDHFRGPGTAHEGETPLWTPIYIGGDFNTVGKITNAGGIAICYPSDWGDPTRANRCESIVGGDCMGFFSGSVNAISSTYYNAGTNSVFMGGRFDKGCGFASFFPTRNLIEIAHTNTSNQSYSRTLTGSIRALAGTADTLYIGGDFPNFNATGEREHLIKWNGSGFSAVDTAESNGPVNTIALITDGSGAVSNLVVGGEFSSYDGKPASGYISQKQVGAWSGYGLWGSAFSGLDGEVYASVIEPDTGDLYVGGSFSSIGGISANNVAKWNGKEWSNLSATASIGTDGPVYAMAIYGSYLYIGGKFTSIDSLSGRHFATYDLSGHSWSVSASTDLASINAIAADSSGVYVGGEGGQRKLDGTNWNNIDHLVQGGATTVRALLLDAAHNLYSGGDYWGCVTKPCGSFAVYSGGTWTDLAEPQGTIYSLYQSSDGYIYAGGDLHRTSPALHYYLGRWDGSAWSVEGQESDGFTSEVYAIGEVNGNLIAAGRFGGSNAYAAIRYSGNWTNAVCDDSPNGPVRTVSVRGSDGAVYVGGSFSSAGRVSTNALARCSGVVGTGTDSGDMSSLLDAGGAGHLIYSTDAPEGLKFRSLDSGYWGLITTLSTGDTSSPSISYDTSSNDLYAAWVTPTGIEWASGPALDSAAGTYARTGVGTLVGEPSVPALQMPWHAWLESAGATYSLLSDEVVEEEATPTPTQTATEAPTLTPTSVLTATQTRTPTVAATLTNTPVPTSTRTQTATRTITPTPTETGTPSPSPTITVTRTATSTRTITNTPTITNTRTPSPTGTATSIYTLTPTKTVTLTPTPYVVLYGWVRDADSKPLLNVLLDAGPLGTARTDTAGKYTLRVVPGVTYSIGPRLTGYTFSPSAASGLVSGDTEASFTATSITYKISGHVLFKDKGLKGVTIDGGVLGQTTTDPDGGYSFTKVGVNTQYVLRASLGGYIIRPGEQSGTLGADTVVDFTASATTFSITGTVKLGGKALSGVTVDAGELGSKVTDRSGTFAFRNIDADTAYTLIPAYKGYTFAPSGRTGVLRSNVKHDFEAIAQDVAGADTRIVSVSAAGIQGNADSGDLEMGATGVSSDGQFTAFSSLASNLVAKDTNEASDVFVRDRKEYTTTRVSVNDNGEEGNAASGVAETGRSPVSLSDDGNLVAFSSLASNLVPDDGNGFSDVFLYNAGDRKQTLVSQSSGGIYGDRASSSPSVSGDGKKVAFVSEAANLVDGDTNEQADIFVRDVSGGTTLRASVNSDGAEANAASSSPSIDGKGASVVFSSKATNLSANDNNEQEDVFFRDLLDGTTMRVSSGPDSSDTNGASINPVISRGGRFVAYASRASNIVPGDTNGYQDVFVYDRSTGITTLISANSAGDLGNADSGVGQISMSADGRYIAFTSDASNLDPKDKNGVADVFIHDRVKHQTGMMSKRPSGAEGNKASGGAAIAPDGRTVGFASAATNLVNTDTNEFNDVFLARIGPLPALIGKATRIYTAPTTVTRSRQLTVVMQVFTIGGTSTGAGFALVPAFESGFSGEHILATKKSISYKVTVSRTAAKRDTQQYSAKRNILTIKNVKPGSYTTSYHVQVKQNNRTVYKTKESPKRKVLVPR